MKPENDCAIGKAIITLTKKSISMAEKRETIALLSRVKRTEPLDRDKKQKAGGEK